MRDGFFAINLGVYDRGIRAVIGLAGIAAWAFGWLGGIWAPVVGTVGIVLALTAVFGVCPLYRLLGVRTAPMTPRL